MATNVFIGNSSIVVPQGKVVRYTVTKDGYYPQCGTLVMNKSQSINVSLSTTPKHTLGDLITDENTGEVKAIVVGLDTENSKYFAVLTAKYRKLIGPDDATLKSTYDTWVNYNDMTKCSTDNDQMDTNTATYNNTKLTPDSATMLPTLNANVIKYNSIECPVVIPNKQQVKMILENSSAIDSADPTASLTEYANYTMASRYATGGMNIGSCSVYESESTSLICSRSSDMGFSWFSEYGGSNAIRYISIIELPD